MQLRDGTLIDETESIAVMLLCREINQLRIEIARLQGLAGFNPTEFVRARDLPIEKMRVPAPIELHKVATQRVKVDPATGAVHVRGWAARPVDAKNPLTIEHAYYLEGGIRARTPAVVDVWLHMHKQLISHTLEILRTPNGFTDVPPPQEAK